MKTLILKILILSTLLFCVVDTHGQQFSFQSLTTKEGLPSNTIYQIKQDKKGFIWMATANGLARYDSRHFQLFNPEGIKDKDILGLFIDNKNQVWFWNLKGQLFYIKENKIYSRPIKDKKIVDFIQDKKGIYWFISKDDGLYQLKGTTEIKQIKKTTSLKRLNIEDGNVLAGYGSTQYIYKDDKLISEFVVTGIYPKRSYLKEAFRFNILNNQRFTLQLPENFISIIDKKGFLSERPFEKYRHIFKDRLVNIYQDNDRNYWITTIFNTYVFDKNFQPLNNKLPILPNETVNHYFNDNEGNHWLVVKDKGIKIIPSIAFTSKKLENASTSAQSLLIHNNNLLIGTSRGKLIIKNLKTNSTNNIQFENDFLINGIHKADKNNSIWVQSHSKAIYLDNNYSSYVNNIGKRIISYKTIWNKSDSLPLLIGEYSGVLKIPNQEIPDFIKINQAKFNLSWFGLRKRYQIKGVKNRTYAIEKVRNEFWFGTTDGLYYYEKDTAVLSQISELKNSWITSIINQNDTVWIGTQTDGLFQIVNKKVIKVFNKKNGLVSNNCKSLIVESNGTIWVGTNNGINKIDINTGEINLINNLDGLLNSDINALAVNERFVFVATSDGLTSFDKRISTKNRIAPPIYLSKFQIFERDTTLAKEYTLRHDRNNIRIHFTGISFRSQGTFKYKYRMKEISEIWTETQSNIASYPILNPGEYTFEAYAINEDGIESKQPIVIKIIVRTPFWQTWWFFIITTLILFSAVLLASWLRLKRIEDKLQVENNFQQKINELEMKALQAQMNPHFIFNALNAIQHYLTIGNDEQAMIYLAKFAKLIRMIFEFSKKMTISLTDEITFLKLYLELEKLRFKDKVTIDFQIDDVIYTDTVKIPPLLIQPIIENAFKHGLLHRGKGGELKIHFQQIDNATFCTVQDNGIGRQKSKSLKSWKHKHHNSSGLSTTEERLSLWISKSQNELDIIPFQIIDLVNDNGEGSGTFIKMLLKVE